MALRGRNAYAAGPNELVRTGSCREIRRQGASRDSGPVVTVAHIDGTRDLPALYVERVPARTDVDIAVDRSWIAETEIDISVVAQARRR